MSTRATVASGLEGDMRVHLYHEMHDNAHHLEMTSPVKINLPCGGHNSYINVIIPEWAVRDLRSLIERAAIGSATRKAD